MRLSGCYVLKHPLARVLDHVATQTAGVAEASVALLTFAGLLPGVSPQVDLQVASLREVLPTLDAPVRLLTRVDAHAHPHG